MMSQMGLHLQALLCVVMVCWLFCHSVKSVDNMCGEYICGEGTGDSCQDNQCVCDKQDSYRTTNNVPAQPVQFCSETCSSSGQCPPNTVCSANVHLGISLCVCMDGFILLDYGKCVTSREADGLTDLNNESSIGVGLYVGVAFGVLVILGVAVGAILIRRRRNSKKASQESPQNASRQTEESSPADHVYETLNHENGNSIVPVARF